MPTRVVTRTPDRRVPYKRGLQTRQRLMEATIELLDARSYRDIKVVDIARKVGTSPATFYQYFPDVEDVVLEASRLLVDETKTALDGFKDGSWSSDGLPGATRLVDAVLDGWSSHLPVVRVLTAVAAEGEPRFYAAYIAATKPLSKALTAAAQTITPGRVRKEVVHSLVCGLTAAAGHENAGSVQGLTKRQRRQGLARVVHAAVTTAAA
ncbi:TetR/AcrR family transcriptional regulator (plasmid) [Streptomyces xanthophaeus]|uniref:TetR/AcrR family transcriptional regulator n=1 Tax=Streptomyces xanthophaeus TaxID=67385 RepID=UPI002F914431|nr:TetR/AcrR family transcriptional regulator [Streptomyces xanthophaeus]